MTLDADEPQRCRNLLLAILEQAIRDLMSRRKTDSDRARTWLLESPYCRAYCHFLDIDHSNLTAAVRDAQQAISSRLSTYSKARLARGDAWS